MEEQKKQQRRQGIAARRSITGAQRSMAELAICRQILRSEAYSEAKTLLLYAASNGEPSLARVAEQAQKDGKQVAWPVCLPGHLLNAAVAENGVWSLGRYGIPVPSHATQRILLPQEIDLVLAPCTAFDVMCRRVGMGGGYYDRYLPECSRARIWAVAFEAQRVPQAAVGETDCMVHAVITEAGIYSEHEAE